jgi:hypothetical protein
VVECIRRTQLVVTLPRLQQTLHDARQRHAFELGMQGVEMAVRQLLPAGLQEPLVDVVGGDAVAADQLVERRQGRRQLRAA